MSFVNLTHSDIPQNLRAGVDVEALLKKKTKSTAHRKPAENLSKITEIAAYLLIIASASLVFLTGQFPWFMLTLIAFIPLLMLMSDHREA